MKLPFFIQQELDQIRTQHAPENLSVGLLFSQQTIYTRKPVQVRGTVVSVVTIDEMMSKLSVPWFLNLPTTEEPRRLQRIFMCKAKWATKSSLSTLLTLNCQPKMMSLSSACLVLTSLVSKPEGSLEPSRKKLVTQSANLSSVT
jgi:hypothetical protein